MARRKLGKDTFGPSADHKDMSKEGVYSSVPALLRKPDSRCSSWRAGLRQEMPNSICLSKWKLHPGLWSLVNCLDMKSVQKQPHAYMQSRAEGIPKSISRLELLLLLASAVWDGKLLILCYLHNLLSFFLYGNSEVNTQPLVNLTFCCLLKYSRVTLEN